MVNMEKYFKVGVVSSTHGVRGEVKVFPTTDDPKRFKKLKEVVLTNGKEESVRAIEGVKFFKQFVIVKFKDIDSLNDVEKYRGYELLIPRSDAVKLDKNEYYSADLIDLKVISDDGKYSGVLFDVLQTGANDVYEIHLEDGREVLLPAIKECILEVNVEEGYLKFHAMEGLID